MMRQLLLHNALVISARRCLAHWRSRLLFRWSTSQKGHFGYLALVAVPVLVMGAMFRFAYVDQMRIQAAQQRRADLSCLAENIYHEARGEPLAGQYAVAEVTLNRVTSPLFPATVCAVVHEARWDPGRQRYVGAFSWTELEPMPAPTGLAWERAVSVAATVYDNREAPLVEGALFYHATYIVPNWARTKTRVARIGRHLFYL